MSTLKANIIDSHSTSTEFKETITANGDSQWLDTYGVIKANRDTIAESITIPSGTNGLSSGPVTIADGHTITVNGEWQSYDKNSCQYNTFTNRSYIRNLS